MSNNQPSQPTDGIQPRNERRYPVMAIVLTLIGDFIFLNFGVGLFIGLAASGLFLYWTTVLFITTVGVVCSVVLMVTKPMMHKIWGILVLALTGWAISADGSFLFGSYDYASSIAGPIAIEGIVLWSIPIGLVILGGVLAIRWKAPTSA